MLYSQLQSIVKIKATSQRIHKRPSILRPLSATAKKVRHLVFLRISLANLCTHPPKALVVSRTLQGAERATEFQCGWAISEPGRVHYRPTGSITPENRAGVTKNYCAASNLGLATERDPKMACARELCCRMSFCGRRIWGCFWPQQYVRVRR